MVSGPGRCPGAEVGREPVGEPAGNGGLFLPVFPTLIVPASESPGRSCPTPRANFRAKIRKGAHTGQRSREMVLQSDRRSSRFEIGSTIIHSSSLRPSVSPICASTQRQSVPEQRHSECASFWAGSVPLRNLYPREGHELAGGEGFRNLSQKASSQTTGGAVQRISNTVRQMPSAISSGDRSVTSITRCAWLV